MSERQDVISFVVGFEFYKQDSEVAVAEVCGVLLKAGLKWNTVKHEVSRLVYAVRNEYADTTS